MKLPWVSRATLDLCRHNTQELVGQLRLALSVAEARAVAAEANYEKLLDRYHLLKVAGAVEVPKPVQFQAPIPNVTDELKSLIHERCGRNYQLRGMMLRQLDADRANGIADDDIRGMITNGISSDGVPT